jgi:outer membrane protein insertion porin family
MFLFSKPDNPGAIQVICSLILLVQGAMLVRWLISGSLSLLCLSGVTAAKPPDDSSPSHADISPATAAATTSIISELSFAGLRHISPLAVEAQISSRAGNPLDARQIEADVRTLARLGWFESVRVEARASTVPSYPSRGEPERTAIIFHVKELPFLSSVKYSGSRLLSQKEIEKLLGDNKLTPALGHPANPASLQRIAFAIKIALNELGHPEASVEIQRKGAPNATVSIRFEISDGPQRRVRQVSFAGDPQFSANLLQAQMHSITPQKPFASLRNKNAYTQDAFEEDRQRILSFYQDHGYPEARIGNPQITRLSETSRHWLLWPRQMTRNGLSLSIPVQAGPLYRFESIKYSRALQQVEAERGAKRVEIPEELEGTPYSARAIENFRRSLLSRMQQQNLKDHSVPLHSVEARPALNPDKHTASVTLDLSDSPPYLVQRIEFQGLRKFRDRYLRRRIPLREGQPVNDRALEVGLARLARTGYFKPIRKENIRVEMNDATHTANITIRVEEIGQQRASLIGGHGQFGSTLGIAYTLFDLLNREELLSAQLEGGPESLQIMLGLAKEGIFGTRASLAFSVFNNVLRPRFATSAQGPFFTAHNVGISIPWTYAASNTDSIAVTYTLSHATSDYRILFPPTSNGVTSSNVQSRTSSSTLGAGWAHDIGNERLAFSNSVSGGVLGGGENMLRASGEYGRIVRDPVFPQSKAWAFRTTFSGAGSYRGEMPFFSRFFSGDEIVRGLRPGELGPYALTPKPTQSGAGTYTVVPAGANLVAGANAEYRIPLARGTEAAGFFDVGSGWLLPHWLGPAKPLLLPATNGVLHGSTGVELRWTVPGVNVPFRAYYALNLLRLDRSIRLSDKSVFFARNRFAAFGWGLGSLF